MTRHLSVLALALSASTGSVLADLCTIEATPAATLLLPYFEVDLDDPNGVDTFLSVNNAGPYGLLGHVVVCRYLLDLDEASTAVVLGVPRGTVKSRLARGLARLREDLATTLEEVDHA